jgi:spore coat polysaccharide biosynthesis predicted glycosyltransferase SpsG
MRLLYRADGGHPIGTGHLFRAVRVLRALSERVDLQATLMFAEDAAAHGIAEAAPARKVVLPPRRDAQAVKPRLIAEPVVHALALNRYDLVAIDMLDTPDEEMREVARADVPIVTLDDRGEGRRRADTIINVLVSEPQPRLLRPETRLLEGGAYVTLDPIFRDLPRPVLARLPAPLRKVFVAMGGADAAGLTVKVASALRMVEGLERVEFVCGPAFPHRELLQSMVAKAPWEHALLSTLPNLLDRYQWCDLAVVAGGFTMYEVCCTGTPALAVCQPIDHQFELAERLSEAGAMATVGWGLEASVEEIAGAVRALRDDSDRRVEMSRNGPALVDGRGTDRVADALMETASRSG